MLITSVTIGNTCKRNAVKGAVSSFTHILFLYFLAILRISYRFNLIKAHKLHYFYLLLYSRDNRCAAKSLQFQRLHPASIFAFSMLEIHCIPNKLFCVDCRIISFDLCYSVAFLSSGNIEFQTMLTLL